jgi:hypothetical protein
VTLILTMVSPKRVIQVSDRRITLSWPNGTSTVKDDDENKSLYVLYADANFAVSYTGIARIQNEPTHNWLAKKLAHSGMLNLGLAHVKKCIRTDIVIETRRYSPRQGGKITPTIFVLAGYQQKARGHRLCPYRVFRLARRRVRFVRC